MGSDYSLGILVIVLSVLLRFMGSDYPLGILAIVLSVLLRFMGSDYPLGILVNLSRTDNTMTKIPKR
jgi:hypothetical protein